MGLLLACGSGDESDGANAAGGAGASGAAGGAGALPPQDSGVILDGALPDASDPTACGDQVRPIFVLTQTGAPVIHRFDPAALTFSQVVAISCPGTDGWTVASMAVDRSYHAWIEWGGTPNGESDPFAKRLDRIDLATGGCDTDRGELPKVVEWGTPLGMAFVTDTNGGSAERLFFVDTSTRLYGLSATGALGQYYEFKPGEGTVFSGVELSGTGEGRLFNMIMNWTPEFDHPCTAQDPCGPTVHLGEVDKATGKAISNVEVPDVEAMGISPGGFAFAHWGGHFWFFISKDFGPTRVYDYDPVAKKTVLTKSDGPDGVVGAGVSTCAPLQMPK